MNVKILGIDTSCDDTSAAVVEDGARILSSVVSSQNEIHARYRGVVPELASRRHIEMIRPVIFEALNSAGIGIKEISAEISAVAVCHGPGLIGSLLVGTSFAKGVSYAAGIPLIGIHHLEGHIHAAFLEPDRPEFPFLALVVSGGHTSIFHAVSPSRYKEIGKTLDDAAGEAYDKVAKLLGLGYPGGPIIDRLAAEGDAAQAAFPRPYLTGRHDFSFSGLKTAVLNHRKKFPDARIEDIAAGFQASVVDVLVRKTIAEAGNLGLTRIVLSGGVAANSELRRRMTAAASAEGIHLHLPSVSLCMDNAAMIAAAAHHHYLNGKFSDLSLNPKAYIPLDTTTA